MTNPIFPMFHTFFQLSCLNPSAVPNVELYACAPAGNFLGHELTSDSGRFIAAFSGIRYAYPPTNDLRFQDTVRYEYENDKLILATEEGSECLQFDDNKQNILGQEDCLFLNVYTPNVKGRAPVIVWIHGGAFTSGSGSRSNFGPEYFLDHNVVLVTVNYRLGVLGYASTEDDSLKGNWGQKDQAEAIRWVVRNIRSFGGDPENLNLFGQSSGAVSTMLQLKLPEVKNLIKRGIVHSGSSLVPWGSSKNRLVRNNTLTVVERVGCSSTDTSNLVLCLQGVNASDILQATLNISTDPTDILPFRPVLNASEYHQNDFSSRVPLLIGFMENEATYFYNEITQGNPSASIIVTLIKSQFPELLSELLGVNSEAMQTYIDAVADKIQDFYWGNSTSSNPDPVILALGDALITFPVYEEAQIHQGPVRTFLFNYTQTADLNESGYTGPSHSDELKYFFPSNTTQIRANGSPSDARMSRILLKIWTEFARGRDPLPMMNWEGVSRGGGYLDISNSGLSFAPVPKDGIKSTDSVNEMSERLSFWKNLIS